MSSDASIEKSRIQTVIKNPQSPRTAGLRMIILGNQLLDHYTFNFDLLDQSRAGELMHNSSTADVDASSVNRSIEHV